MTLEDLKRVQEIGTEILMEVDRICKKYNITYYLFYGTLLGAARHKGSIPWDDDVDIAMTRENYCKFYDVAQKELDSSKYHLKVMGSGSIEYFSELKIGKIGTTYALPGTEDLDIMHEVQLDVFCLENARKKSAYEMKFSVRLWNVLNICRLNKDEKILLTRCAFKSKKLFKHVYVAGLWSLHLLRMILGEKLIEKVCCKMFFDRNGVGDSYITLPHDPLFEKSWFGQPKCLLYENIEAPVPCQYEKLLEHYFGDWQKLPPEGRRLRNNFDILIFKEV